MKNGLVMLFSVFFISANAQMVDVKERTSGYFGKRFLFGIAGSFSGSLNYQKAYAVTPGPGISINRDFSAFIHYTVKSNMSIGLVAGTGWTSFNPYDIDYVVNDLKVADSKGIKHTMYRTIGSPLIIDRQIGMDFRFYRSKKGAFSPIGQYLNAGVFAHFYTTDFDAMTFSVYDKDITKQFIVNNTIHPLKFVLPEVYVGAGFCKPIFKDLFIDAAIKFGYLFTNRDAYFINTDTEVVDYFEDEIKKRLQLREYFNLNIGLAYPF